MIENEPIPFRRRKPVYVKRADFFEQKNCALDYTSLREHMSGHEIFPPYGYASWGEFADDSRNNDIKDPYADMEDGSEWFIPAPSLAISVEAVAINNERAEKRHLVADLTTQQWLSIKNWQSNLCAYCDTKGNTMEHFWPIFRHGGTTVTNIVLSCRPCNASKGRRNPMEFLRSIPGGALRLERIRSMFIELGEKYGKPKLAW